MNGKLRLVLVVVLLVLPTAMPGAATGGEDGGGPSAGSGPNVQMVERDGVRYFTASTSERGRPSAFRSSAAPGLILASGGSGWRAEAKNQISANRGAARWVRYDYAQTRRLSGWGDYLAEAHATLIRGSSYEGEQVFSAYERSCAGIIRVNRTARTCSSPRFDTSPGEKWFVISGHTFDHGNDSPSNPEWRVAGELDWVWTASRR